MKTLLQSVIVTGALCACAIPAMATSCPGMLRPAAVAVPAAAVAAPASGTMPATAAVFMAGVCKRPATARLPLQRRPAVNSPWRKRPAWI